MATLNASHLFEIHVNQHNALNPTTAAPNAHQIAVKPTNDRLPVHKLQERYRQKIPAVVPGLAVIQSDLITRVGARLLDQRLAQESGQRVFDAGAQNDQSDGHPLVLDLLVVVRRPNV